MQSAARHAAKTPWAYLIMMFGALAMAFVVLPACVAGESGSNDDEEPVCGNGEIDSGEECDDGNTSAGDGCDQACEIEHVCGDGTLDDSPNSEEECDDGNTNPGDGCDSNCMLEGVCGDGVPDPGEECDDGNTSPGDGCDSSCLLESACGDGSITGLEVCDDGNDLPDDGCAANCLSDETCGNGIIDSDLGAFDDDFPDAAQIRDEVCDDSNTTGGDGCSDDCRAAPLSLLVVEMSGVNVPICARPFYGVGAECDMDPHYHQTAYGFNDAGTAFTSADDPDVPGCGHGKGSEIHPTLKRITVTQPAVDAYIAGNPLQFVPCWGE